MGAEERTWLIMARDLPDSVKVVGMDGLFACLILDMDTGMALGHGLEGESPKALATAVQTALTTSAGTLAPAPPVRVLCGPAIVQQVGVHIGEVARRRGFAAPEVIEVDPIPEAEDIFDSLVGHMSGRVQPSEPPTPADWKQLYSQAARFAAEAPWDTWRDSVELAVEIRIAGQRVRYTAVILGNAAIQRGLVLYQGTGLPEALRDWAEGDEWAMFPGTLTFHLDPVDEAPRELSARASRYDWPDDAAMAPVFLSVTGTRAADVSKDDAQRLSVAIEAVLKHVGRGPVIAGDETSGVLQLAGGVAGRFTVRQMPVATEPDEPGTAHLMVHEVGFDLLPPDSPVSMGSLHASAMPELRRRAQLHRPGPGVIPPDAELPIIVLIPASGTGPGLAARMAEDDPFAVTVVETGRQALVTLACAKAVHALMELPSGAPALALFRARMERSGGHHLVLVADEASSQGQGEVFAVFECRGDVEPRPVRRRPPVGGARRKTTRRGKRKA